MAGLNLNLNSITENTSRLGARIQETFIEHTRDLAIARGPGAAYFDVSEEKVRNVRRQLEANSDREKLDALKTLIALVSKGRNVSDYFPSVVKNVASSNLEIRKLVYIFLLRYAETEPDLALLSINTFQRDLADPNPLIRAMALRVLSGINVPMVANIVILAVKKCSTDPSPYVRKAAALAVIKCYSMDSGHLASLIPILISLLKDKSPLSIGSVAVAFQAICPTRLDLLHTHYRRLCRMLIDADAWGQVNLLELLSRYARRMLPKPSMDGEEETGNPEDVDADLQLLFTSSEPLLMSRNPAVVLAVARSFFYLAPPSQLNKIVSPLLRLLPLSKEIERVVLANLIILIQSSPRPCAPHYSRFFIRASDIFETKQLKICILLHLLSSDNHQIILRELKVYADDSEPQIVSDSIQAIGSCARMVPDSVDDCLSILMGFIKYGSEYAISSSVLVLKALVQARLQIQSNGSIETLDHSPLRIIADLASRIDEVKHASARACVIWLVGQYAALGISSQEELKSEDRGLQGVAWWAPDVLRRVAKTFSVEAPIVKLQVLTLTAKIQVLSTTYHRTFTLLSRYIFSLARYDSNYDVRDRARSLGTLLAGIAPHLHTNGSVDGDGNESDEGGVFGRGGVVLRREQVKLILFEGKLETQEKEHSQNKHDIFGSLDAVTGRAAGLESSLRLPDWSEESTDSSLRDSQEEYATVPITSLASQRTFSGVAGGAGGLGSSQISSKSTSPVVLTPTGRESPGIQGGTSGKGQWKNLDDFLESDSEDEEDSDEDTGESEESEGSVEVNDRDQFSQDRATNVTNTGLSDVQGSTDEESYDGNGDGDEESGTENESS